MSAHKTTLAVLSVVLIPTCFAHGELPAPSMHGRTALTDDEKVHPPSPDADEPANLPGLRHVVAYGPAVLSGSAPDGDVGFDALQAMGVRTIVSVDGAVPALDKANARGLRYVHLPIGYNHIDRERILELAKAVQMARERAPSAPVYIHCHHGKHRSASASAAVAVTLGFLTPEEALLRMKVSGTATNYEGLYRCVAAARPATSEELTAVRGDFPTVWKTTGLVRTMVEINDRFEHIENIQHAGWTTPDDHPDLVPAAEAGRLADLFRALVDDQRVKAKPATFRKSLVEASKHAEALERGLIRGEFSVVASSQQLRLIADSCKNCHARHRDR
jgi:Swiss Army Knife protein, DSP-PTPase phosphatase domain